MEMLRLVQKGLGRGEFVARFVGDFRACESG